MRIYLQTIYEGEMLTHFLTAKLVIDIIVLDDNEMYHVMDLLCLSSTLYAYFQGKGSQ